MFKQLFRKEPAPSRPLLTTTIRLQNDLWVIHPPPEDALAAGTLGDDTIMLSGVATFVSDVHVQIWNVRVALVLQYSYRCSKTQQWKQGIIYEQGQTFEEPCSEEAGSPQALQVFLDLRDKTIKRRIEFGILLPRSLATYEHLPHAKMIPQVRVSVEFSKLTWTPAELAALPPSPPMYVDGEETNMIAGRRFVSESWRGGSVLIEREGPDKIVDSTSSLPSSSNHLRQTWIKNFAIASNPDPTSGPRQLRIQKRGVEGGVGEYTVYLWSDSFSVGSYISPRIEFNDMSPHCNIYSIQLSLVQTYSVVPLDEFKSGQYDAEDHQYPADTFLMCAEGNKPVTNRPGNSEPTLWQGTANRRKTAARDSEEEGSPQKFIWQPKRVRLPDDAAMRPTTLPGTRTPIRVKHKLVVKVFFTVIGETLSGAPIAGGPGNVGDLRMLVVNLPELVPSCCIIAEWVDLPDYEETMKKKGEGDIPVCACCYAIDCFPGTEFERAFPPTARQVVSETTSATLSTERKTPANQSSDSWGSR